ncbi:MAG: DUF1330 domain-containing protein [Rhodocyclaceae bacterium]|nr:DUF1330 domain-containing protein [Rhodocyclaceae bacterium]
MSARGQAYVIGHIAIKDAAKWDDYRSQVPATLTPWGAELVMRGRLTQVLAGEHPYTDTVVIRFPDESAAAGWHGSAAYQALIPLRQQAADVLLLSFVE